jgi:predicted amidophosphoribosyltransferase
LSRNSCGIYYLKREEYPVDFVKCKLCREPFSSYGSKLCPKCQEQTDKDFIAVREYIYDHAGQASVDEIAAATGVSEKSILYLLEEERLSATGALGAAAGLRCRVCGKSISSGIICESCKAALVRELDSAASTLSLVTDDKKAAKGAPNTARGVQRDFCGLSEYGKKR